MLLSWESLVSKKTSVSWFVANAFSKSFILRIAGMIPLGTSIAFTVLTDCYSLYLTYALSYTVIRTLLSPCLVPVFASLLSYRSLSLDSRQQTHREVHFYALTSPPKRLPHHR